MAAQKENKIIIGLVGPISGGKGTAVEFLKEKGFFCSSLSDRIREEITGRGEEITRKKLLLVADELRQEFGPTVLAKRTWQIILKHDDPRVVIDSIRSVIEVDFFKDKPDFYLISVIAPRSIRFNRAKKRNREGEPLTWEEFVRIDKQDFFSGDNRVGRNIPACLEKSDFLIENTGTIEQLRERMVDILAQIYKLNG